MRAASGRALGARSDAVLRTAMAAPGAIAQMLQRVGIARNPSLSAVRGSRIWVNRALTLAPTGSYVADRTGCPQGCPSLLVSRFGSSPEFSARS
jgi:hypothetical protein